MSPVSPPPVLPCPNELGLPAKFTSWRPRQAEAVVRAATCEERFVMPALPTGAGKTVFYFAVGQLIGGRRVILTSTKALQDQIEEDFGSMPEFAIVKGMNAYPCRALTEPRAGHLQDAGAIGSMNRQHGQSVAGETETRTTCDEGPCHFGLRCNLVRGGCHYYDAVRRAETAEIVVTNYAYWLTANQYRVRKDDDGNRVEGIGQFTLQVCDEAHDAEQAITSFLTSIMEPTEVESLLGVNPPPLEGTSQEAWRVWAIGLEKDSRERLDGAKEALGLAATTGRDMKALRREVRLRTKLHQTISRLATPGISWVIEHPTEDPTGPPIEVSKRAIQFAPLWPASLTEEYLFRGTEKVLLVSATVRPKTLAYLGIQREDCLFWEEPSTFALKRRPVYLYGNVRLKWPISDDTKFWWLTNIDRIITARPGIKGIIHTQSFARAREIANSSKHRALMLWHNSAAESWKRGGRSLAQAVAEFRQRSAGAGLWILSPSLTTGYDFPHDQARCQIIVKVPFPDSRGALLKARNKKDDQYVNYLAMQTLVQMVGRIVRGEDDWGETFIVDRMVDWLIGRKYAELSPRWFRDAVIDSVALPKNLKDQFAAEVETSLALTRTGTNRIDDHELPF